MKRNAMAAVLALLTSCVFISSAVCADKLTLADAENTALHNQPQLRVARLTAQAAGEIPAELRSAYTPFVQGNFTGADAAPGTRLAAGALNNPSVFGRYANGLTATQLVTDFGRTQHLIGSARAGAAAVNQDAELVRANVLLQVDRAYYAVLRAQAVLRVAEETVSTRQVLTDQVTALANSNLKSGLDVSFANVALSQAKLQLVRAQNDVQGSMADLSAALGYGDIQQFDLENDPTADAPPPSVDDLLKDAKQQRPDIAAQSFRVQSAHQFSVAERDLWFPSLSIVAAAGLTPVGDSAVFHDHYSATGFNLTVPVFNGFAFNARHKEAQFKEQAEEQRLGDLNNRVTRDVRRAWLNADTAFRNLALTAELLAQTTQALDLAQERYELGLSSIVELSQAQLNQTEAEIEQASARYDYRLLQRTLQFQAGLLR